MKHKSTFLTCEETPAGALHRTCHFCGERLYDITTEYPALHPGGYVHWVGEGSAGYWDHWVHWGCKDMALKLASIDPAINTVTAICMGKLVDMPPKGQRMRPMHIKVLTCLIEDYGHVAFVQKYNLEAMLMRNDMEAGI